ncbi:MAG: leucine-rich repeat domain-containing protein, partial [Bacilli bacterium]|nr:leucine-rich repeat domain-containing protein [Bacilli bacterium]
RICDYAFMELEELKYFECNKNLISIGKGTFLNNPKLQTVILNEGLEYINDRAFAECPNLEYVVIPASVKEVGFEAFTSGIIYIEAEIIPDKWDQNFAGKDVKFYTGNEWEYNEDGIPTPIK